MIHDLFENVLAQKGLIVELDVKINELISDYNPDATVNFVISDSHKVCIVSTNLNYYCRINNVLVAKGFTLFVFSKNQINKTPIKIASFIRDWFDNKIDGKYLTEFN